MCIRARVRAGVRAMPVVSYVRNGGGRARSQMKAELRVSIGAMPQDRRRLGLMPARVVDSGWHCRVTMRHFEYTCL